MSGKITAIESAAEGLPLTVYVDGRPALTVTREMADRLGLRVGMELPSGCSGQAGGAGAGDRGAEASAGVAPEGGTGDARATGRADAGREESERERARNAALRLLAVRARSVHELRGRLARKGFDGERIAETIEALEAAGLLNDEEFARQWAEERVRLKPVGPRRLREELAAKGVPRQVILRVVEATYVENAETDLALRALKKRTRGRRPAKEDGGRLRSFLLRRGFGYEAIGEAFRRLASEDDDEEAGI